jgi:hypothetical protein
MKSVGYCTNGDQTVAKSSNLGCWRDARTKLLPSGVGLANYWLRIEGFLGNVRYRYGSISQVELCP